MITDDQLDNWFTYHVSKPGSHMVDGSTAHKTDGSVFTQQDAYLSIREAGKALAKVIRDMSPASADQTAEVRKVREAVMTANQGIACEGK